jgi:hypothetical protein
MMKPSMTRFALISLAGSLLLVGCDKSARDAGSSSRATSSPAASTLPSNVVETAKAEALKVYRASWTNQDGLWTSFLLTKKWRVQRTNMVIRVEPMELTKKQIEKGIQTGVEVFFDAEFGRNEPKKGKWTEWRPTSALRYPVLMSNGVWHVENNYRRSFALPPPQE